MRASRQGFLRGLFLLATLTHSPVCAQGTAAPPPAPQQPSHQQHAQPAPRHMMMMPGPLGISMTRDGSGTSWLPDRSPMRAIHRQAGSWEFMVHNNVFVQYITENGARGDDQLGSINWVMGMARRKVGRGDFMIRSMVSIEPWTVGECGYPDLLATGEFCNDEPLHDRQHPHDVFMELAALYQAELTETLGYQIYAGAAGEPALGPVAYPHRPSALTNPMAPIGHHWLDATHISFGVVTAGVFGRRWKAEASVFNGREPDQRRYDLDLAALDSFSGRVWFLPNERWAFQVSSGHLNEAEQHHLDEPRTDVNRTTASVTYHRPVGDMDAWATTLTWGRNSAHEESTNAFLAETNLPLTPADNIFGRFEWVQKTADDLVLSEVHDVHIEGVFDVAKVTAGYAREFRVGNWAPGIGASVSMSVVPERLEEVYGGRRLGGAAVFFSLRPAPMPAHMPAAAAQRSGEAARQPAAKPADPHAGHVAAPAQRPAAKPAEKPAAGAATKFADDPKKLTCNPPVDPDSAPTTTYKGKAYYFCTAAERLRFILNPERYLKEAGK